MEKSFTINVLSQKFYNDYDNINYPEIENKDNRPYLVLLILIDNNKFALPFRTNIRHNYAYKFKNSDRNTQSVTGIDFTKAVIVNNPDYIDYQTTIDNKEYVELSNKYYFIINKFKKYLNDYIDFCNKYTNEYQARKYQYTTLKYFHKELNIQ